MVRRRARRTPPRRCPRSCRPAARPSACRTPRTTSSRHAGAARRSGRRRSRAAWPAAAARGSAARRRATCVGDLVDRARSGRGTTGRSRWPRTTSSTVAPPRSACCTVTIRPSVGVCAGSSSVGACSALGCSPSQWNVEPVLLERAQRLLQRLGEVAADRHRLADGLHGGGQGRVRGGELLEREPRHLDDDVVERRLEARPASPR